ncbi:MULTISPECIES: GntR family transcriptional regulator [unclassified Bifidobacterium]|uniref:GntR family transcriptional regulator n=1 Tax=unclassified Bifidobacterium TaxID=2608897 RepID=UPI0011278DF8|nr:MULTISPECIES: GntR family transcriptional regulator [unclassified Bifidobacterium]TPF79084.1 GntR family transcriptional regulator [Bifidobacterium sp. UTCIF-1]TPF80955.1 GntR family transcriptional regulator [Bifidobacterium sp. UTCIF-24]TPF83248.1 GntR family transcriptional regulator [Bifidobacterium sp. UTCIF-3]TPF84991.1 GntR family transcriptional regulator [Bifidobacterium sp. UTCIF-36]TPF88978.1 GntR family transcriptional regulator [Bifidobacterium sp. UTBIF-56]
MKLIISSVSGEPIYEQIKTQIRTAVLDGDLKAGEALPSLRKLAKELRTSVLTVTRAYNELADEGVVQNIQGKGTFVMDKGNELMKQQLEAQIRTNLAEASRAAKAADMPLERLGEMLVEEYRAN